MPAFRFSPLLSWLAYGLLAVAAADGPVRVDRMRADLDFLCSPALEGRVSLSRAADASAEYIAAEFRKAGLRPANGDSYLQAFPLVAYRPSPARRLYLHRNGGTVEFQPTKDIAAGFHRDVDVKVPVVFAGYGITAPEYRYDDYASIDVSNKIVLVFDHEPQETKPDSVFNGTGHTRYAARWTKLLNAQRHGAVGALVVPDPLRKHGSVFDPPPPPSPRATAPLQALEEPIRIPSYTVTEAVADQMLKPLGKSAAALAKEIDAALKPASVALRDTVAEIRNRNEESHRGTSLNAVGKLEGSDPALKSETVLLTAHYDHLGMRDGKVYCGANDNASGTAGVMELARMFAAQQRRPKRTLLLIVFGSEEEGLLGSYFYTDHPLRPLATTRAVVNLDMIARDEAHIAQSQGVIDIATDTSNAINLVGTFAHPGLRAAIQRANEKVGLTLDLKHERDHDLNTLFRCDHFPFLLRDVPAVWLFGGFHPGYHEPIDTVDRLNFTKLEKVTRLAYLTALDLADAAPGR